MREKEPGLHFLAHLCRRFFRASKGRRNTVMIRRCQYGFEHTISIELIDGIRRVDEISKRRN